MENQLVKQKLSLSDLNTVSETFFQSGMFTDVKSAKQAMVKIMAGAEVGISPFQAMSGVHIILGKPVMGSGLIASKIKSSGKYDYRVTKMTDDICSIDFYQTGDKIGTSEFTIADARKAQTKNIEKFPKNMLFARAISNGVKWFCPDVFSGPVYVPEEEHLMTEDTEFTEIPQKEPLVIEEFILNAIDDAKTLDEVVAIYNDNPDLRLDTGFLQILGARKKAIKKLAQEEAKESERLTHLINDAESVEELKKLKKDVPQTLYDLFDQRVVDLGGK